MNGNRLMSILSEAAKLKIKKAQYNMTTRYLKEGELQSMKIVKSLIVVYLRHFDQLRL